MKTGVQEIGGLIREPRQLGAIVRARRKAAKLTQAQAAGLAGVGNRFFSELERGKPTLELGLVLKVLERFGLEVMISPRPGRAEAGRSADHAPPARHKSSARGAGG